MELMDGQPENNATAVAGVEALKIPCDVSDIKEATVVVNIFHEYWRN